VRRLERHYDMVKAALEDSDHPIHRRIPPRSEGEEMGRFVVTYARLAAKTGRNDPCPCLSGKKFKRCCMLSADRTRG
jgi:uncharacterized protein YecA (UPF0149 family)